MRTKTTITIYIQPALMSLMLIPLIAALLSSTPLLVVPTLMFCTAITLHRTRVYRETLPLLFLPLLLAAATATAQLPPLTTNHPAFTRGELEAAYDAKLAAATAAGGIVVPSQLPEQEGTNVIVVSNLNSGTYSLSVDRSTNTLQSAVAAAVAQALARQPVAATNADDAVKHTALTHDLAVRFPWLETLLTIAGACGLTLGWVKKTLHAWMAKNVAAFVPAAGAGSDKKWKTILASRPYASLAFLVEMFLAIKLPTLEEYTKQMAVKQAAIIEKGKAYEILLKMKSEIVPTPAQKQAAVALDAATKTTGAGGTNPLLELAARDPAAVLAYSESVNQLIASLPATFWTAAVKPVAEAVAATPEIDMEFQGCLTRAVTASDDARIKVEAEYLSLKGKQ